MKKSIFGLSLIALSLAAILTGCVHRRVVYLSTPPQPGPPPVDVVVSQAPPPAQQEVIVASPGPSYYWVPGYWSWQGHWIWVRGAWTLRPHPRAVYVAGRWVHRGHGYVWVSGRWR
jgi:hypothetical protein